MEARVLPLSEEQIEHFYREGYVLAESLVPAPVVDAIMQAARDRAREGDRWQPTIFLHDEPHKDAQLHQALWTRPVFEAATQLLGAPARIYYGMLAIVPAHGGNGLPWHQDNQYSHILGGALNIFIALCDISPDMATLWVSPRSHRLGVQPSKTNDTTAPGHREAVVEPANPTQLPPLKAGDACIFDRCTMHRSLQNTSDKHRYAYAAQYQSDHARMAETGLRDEKRMRAEDLSHEFPSIIRTPADQVVTDKRMHI